jgi:peptidoglycan/LPS O-acetylase OafA/YrhL
MTPFAWFGWVGVEVFFVISGFVIAGSANGASPMAFLRSRAMRLLPAAWVCATVTLAVRLAYGASWTDGLGEEYLASLVIWPHGPWIDGVYWSLAVEIVFYALVFVLLLSRSFRRIAVLAWALTLVSSVFIAVYMLERVELLPDNPVWRAINAQSELLPLKHGVYFALGIWIWMLSNRIARPSAWIGVVLTLAFGVVEIWTRAFELRHTDAPIAEHQSAFIPVLVWLVAVGAIAAFAFWPNRFSPKSPLAQTALKQLGKITYPLYLVHAIAGIGLMSWMITVGVAPYIALVITIISVIALAAAIAFVAEPFFRSLLGRATRPLAQPSSGENKFFAGLFRPTESVSPAKAG